MPKLTQTEIYDCIGSFRLNSGKDENFNLFEVIELSVNDVAINALLEVKDLDYYVGKKLNPILESHHMFLINNIMHTIYGNFNKFFETWFVISSSLKCNKSIFIDKPFTFSSILTAMERNKFNFLASFEGGKAEIDLKALVFKNFKTARTFLKRFNKK